MTEETQNQKKKYLTFITDSADNLKAQIKSAIENFTEQTGVFVGEVIIVQYQGIAMSDGTKLSVVKQIDLTIDWNKGHV